MKLSSDQIAEYSNNGFLVIKDVFKHEEIEIISQTIDCNINDHTTHVKHLEGLVLEKNKDAVRTLNGVHLQSEAFAKLCSNPRLLQSAQQILSESNLYVHQFKINFKEAFTGDIWDWHQDYIYWLKGDGMPEPKAVSVAILLDNVNEFNGPLMFIPGSHKIGTIDVEPQEQSTGQHSWVDNVSARLKYPAPKNLVKRLIKDNNLVALKASAGSIVFFDCNLLHASNSNLSPFCRKIILITYNPVSNVNPYFNQPRPNFLASRDFTPLSVIDDKIIEIFTK